MKCRIELHLRGSLYTYEEIHLPAYNHDLTRRDNDEIYDRIIHAYAEKIRAENVKAIERLYGDCIVCAVFESKMNYRELLPGIINLDQYEL